MKKFKQEEKYEGLVRRPPAKEGWVVTQSTPKKSEKVDKLQLKKAFKKQKKEGINWDF